MMQLLARLARQSDLRSMHREKRTFFLLNWKEPRAKQSILVSLLGLLGAALRRG